MTKQEKALKTRHRREAGMVRLIPMLEAKQRGDRITAQEIIDATGDEGWDGYRKRILTWAARRGFVLWPVPNDGYRIGLSHEHYDSHNKNRRSSLHYDLKAHRALESTPVNELTDNQVRRHQHALSLSQQRVQTAKDHDRQLAPKRLKREDRVPLRISVESGAQADE